MSDTQAYVGLGSNLEEPEAQVTRAIFELRELPRTRLVAASSLYSSAPLGPSGQPDYVNAVAHLVTGLGAAELLSQLHLIEARHGRVREQRWGARTLDLDLLLFGDETIDMPGLVVPHYALRERNFVLLPLLEIAPDLVLPGGEPLAEIADRCPRAGLRRLRQSPVLSLKPEQG